MLYGITYMWNLKYDTNELIYKQKQTHRHKEQIYGYQRVKGLAEGQDWSRGLSTNYYI